MGSRLSQRLRAGGPRMRTEANYEPEPTGGRPNSWVRIGAVVVGCLCLLSLLAPGPAHADGVTVLKNVPYGMVDGYTLLPDEVNTPEKAAEFAKRNKEAAAAVKA